MRSIAFTLTFIAFLCDVLGDRNDTCRTPDEEFGQCISIRKCPALYDLMLKKPLKQSNINFLRKSHCGFDGRIAKVCCPNQTVSPVSTEPTPDDDVLESVRSKLLPDSLSCGAHSGKKILGGQVADLDEFPWMTLITYELPDRSREFACGGVLISKRYVLTAAHCLKGNTLPPSWRLVAVRLGEFNKNSDEDCIVHKKSRRKECLKSPPIDVEVEERIVHKGYDPDNYDKKHDIALLRLKRDVKFTDYIKPICLPFCEKERNRNYAGSKLIVAGWGITEQNVTSDVKLKLVVPVYSNRQCNSIYSAADRTVSDRQMCAGGEENRDSCEGDSGGPLMSISTDEYDEPVWYAVGVVSYGPDPCGYKGWPGVYTRVSKYLGWIERQLKP